MLENVRGFLDSQFDEYRTELSATLEKGLARRSQYTPSTIEKISEGWNVFKNVMMYRVVGEWTSTQAQLEEALQADRFAPCGASQEKSVGWLESQIGGWMEALTAPPFPVPDRRPNLR